MSLPIVLRSTFENVRAEALRIESELRAEVQGLRDDIARLHDAQDAAVIDRDRVAAALARATAEADRLAAALNEKRGELAELTDAFATYREEALGTAEAERATAEAKLSSEAAAREVAEANLRSEAVSRENAEAESATQAAARQAAETALTDARARLQQATGRLDEFRAEIDRLGSQVMQLQALHRADADALTRLAGDRERMTTRLKDFESEAERLGAQLFEQQALGRADAEALARVAGERDLALQRLQDFEAEAERLGAQLLGQQALGRADAEALARVAGERDVALLRLKDFEAETQRLGEQLASLQAEARETSQQLHTAHATRDALAARVQSLVQQFRSPDERDNGKAYFIVVSLGRTASQWLVSVLNEHPQILASHALDLSAEKRAPASRGDDFLQSIERQEALRVQGLDLDAAFDRMESDGYAAIGNVHGLDGLPAIVDANAFRRRYRVFYQIRHPILRIPSLVRRWTYEISLHDTRRAALRALFEEHRGRFSDLPGADFDTDDDWLFAYAVAYLIPAERQYLHSTTPIVVFERLISDRDYFAWFLGSLTRGAVTLDRAFLDTAFATAPVDALQLGKVNASDVFSTWSPWRRTLFVRMLEQAGTQSHYAALGYETDL